MAILFELGQCSVHSLFYIGLVKSFKGIATMQKVLETHAFEHRSSVHLSKGHYLRTKVCVWGIFPRYILFCQLLINLKQEDKERITNYLHERHALTQLLA